jgi:hypothetical protein
MATIIQNHALSTLVERALPSNSGTVKYNSNTQMYETERYVSAAGNSYFRGIKLSDRIVLEFCCGDGYMYRFINAIRVYCFNGSDKQLIDARSYNSTIYNEKFCCLECLEMVCKYLKTQAQMFGGKVEDSTIMEFSKQLIEATNQLLIA